MVQEVGEDAGQLRGGHADFRVPLSAGDVHVHVASSVQQQDPDPRALQAHAGACYPQRHPHPLPTASQVPTPTVKHGTHEDERERMS